MGWDSVGAALPLRGVNSTRHPVLAAVWFAPAAGAFLTSSRLMTASAESAPAGTRTVMDGCAASSEKTPPVAALTFACALRALESLQAASAMAMSAAAAARWNGFDMILSSRERTEAIASGVGWLLRGAAPRACAGRPLTVRIGPCG